MKNPNDLLYASKAIESKSWAISSESYGRLKLISLETLIDSRKIIKFLKDKDNG